MIDTPGHADFEKIRQIGSKIAHITLVMVDITKGIDSDTLEYLRENIKTSADYDTTIIVLNKMDKIYAYNKIESINSGHCSLKRIMNKQPKIVLDKLNEYIQNISIQLAQIGLYGESYYNKICRECLVMIPISANTGDGIPDLLLYMSNARMTLEGGEKLIIDQEDIDIDIDIDIDNPDTAMSRTKKEQIDGALDKSKSLGYILDKRLDDRHGKIIIGILKYGSISRTDSIKIGLNNYPINSLMTTVGYSDSREGHFAPVETVDYAISFIIKVDTSVYELINLGDEFTVGQDRTIHIDDSAYEELDTRKRKLFSEYGVHVIIPSESMLEAIHTHFEHENIPIQSYSIGTMSKSEIIKYINKKHRLSNIPDYNKRYQMIMICTPDRLESTSDSSELMIQEYFEPDKIQILNSADVKIIFGGTIYKLATLFNNHLKYHRESTISKYGSYSEFDADVIPKYIFRNEDPIICGIKLNSGSMVIDTEVYSSNRTKYYGKIRGIQLEMKDIDVVHPGMEVCLKIVGGTHKLTKGEPIKLINKIDGLENVVISRLVSDDIIKTRPKPSIPKPEPVAVPVEVKTEKSKVKVADEKKNKKKR